MYKSLQIFNTEKFSVTVRCKNYVVVNTYKSDWRILNKWREVASCIHRAACRTRCRILWRK
jgi:hypothetical protein